MESREHALEVASALAKIAKKLKIGLIYKTSFDKANRTSASAARGLGIDKAIPIFKEIAAKYKGQDVVAKLTEKVRKGGAGSFGPVPMAPNPPDKINDADLKAAVELILKS